MKASEPTPLSRRWEASSDPVLLAARGQRTIVTSEWPLPAGHPSPTLLSPKTIKVTFLSQPALRIPVVQEEETS